jgi:solute carrier family 32 (vesicular inhibitory amino acid transporter)
MQNFD